MPLREAIAGYLGTARAVRCEPSQILVTTGSQQGLQLSAQVLLDTNEQVWVEDPGYPGARQALMMAGAKHIPVPVDHEGLDVAEGIQHALRARMLSQQMVLSVLMRTNHCCSH
jgi:GntR family transcriptional regulator/MocR family aminotransferase